MKDTKSTECLCCLAGLPTEDPRICPECGHTFKGNWWDGIDAHWRAKHEAILPYEEFWGGLCEKHGGLEKRHMFRDTVRRLIGSENLSYRELVA